LPKGRVERSAPRQTELAEDHAHHTEEEVTEAIDIL
jgi:hypothetical protein